MSEKIFKLDKIERLKALEGLKLASFKQRAIAFTTDLLICFLLFLVMLLIVGLFLWYNATDGTFTTYSFRFDTFSWYGKIIFNILIPILYFGLYTYFSNGKTVGKKLMKIRVVSLADEKITLWNSLERSLGYGASAIELGMGFFQYFFDSNGRTSQDYLAETIVICE
ncbi:MAG: RDD family protein [FCB group bacterium]|nr:RDD family protein [FCB group bacterium]